MAVPYSRKADKPFYYHEIKYGSRFLSKDF